MSFDHIADMFTRIRNAQRAGNLDVSMPSSNFKLALAQLLYKNGFLDDVSIFSEGNKKYLRLKLRYVSGRPAILGVQQVSKQGQRIYAKKGEIPFVKNGFGLMLISTPNGVLTDSEARKQKVGGELIAKVW